PDDTTPFRCCSASRSFTYTAAAVPYTLSLHDALPICVWNNYSTLRATASASGCVRARCRQPLRSWRKCRWIWILGTSGKASRGRSEEHTSELQSRENLVCRLLLEEKK